MSYPGGLAAGVISPVSMPDLLDPQSTSAPVTLDGGSRQPGSAPKVREQHFVKTTHSPFTISHKPQRW